MADAKSGSGFTELLKSLAGKLNPLCQSALQNALGLCLAQTHYEVELEHWFLKLLEPANSDLSRIFHHYDVNANKVTRELSRALEPMRRGSGRSAVQLSPNVVDLMREAWVLTSLNYLAPRIRSGYLLTALLTDQRLLDRICGSSSELVKIPGDQLRREVRVLIEKSVEEDASAAAGPEAATTPSGAPVGTKTPALDQFTLNLTERAQKGEIDPVIGRDFEIRQVIDILTRRRQNNPILTGEAGVGKTAVVEGFALRVVSGDVPGSLKGVAVRTLDLGLLQAGAGVKGEFENRLKSIIAEVKASPQPIILFIDEAHTIIGAGGQAGQGDAANLLKPALARGELRTVAATTWAEYKKYFETDAALKRRFQVVKVDEPNESLAVRMMRGVTITLEKHHKVRILDEAIEDAVKLSHRYITDRQLPDKSVSLLDTACARVALGQSATPPAVEDCRREIEHATIEIRILEREKAVGADHEQRLQELTERKEKAEKRLVELEKRWEEEKSLVGEIQRLRGRLEAHASDGKDAEKLKPDEEARCKAELGELRQKLAKIQGETPLVQPVVDRQAVAEVVSGWTGIPVGKMVLDEIKTVLTLGDRLAERVIGQQHALEAVAERIRTSRAGLLDPRRPIGVFLLVGPSGVGKTETAMALADALYGGDRNMVVINMSEYKDEMNIPRLYGPAPGLVGYGEGGVLTNAVIRKPYSVVLLDEVEKAHPGVHDVFYQVFDKGSLRDEKGTDVDFKNTIILLTSNAGTDTIMKLCADPDTCPDAEGLAAALRPDLLKVFKPALLGRMMVVPFFPLGDEVIRKIIKLQLKRVGDRIRLNHRATFEYDDKVVETIASRCKEVESGARNVDHIITGTLLPSISREFLSRMAEGQPIAKVSLGVDASGQFAFQFAGNGR
jgi:type VI secretion system protein VasG